MLSYILIFFNHTEGVIISVVYFALAYALYIIVVKKLATAIEEKYFPPNDSEISATVVALSLTAFVGFTRLIRL
jgi:Ca2+/Na+ antiporter